MGAVIIREINIRVNDKRQTLTECPLVVNFIFELLSSLEIFLTNL